MAKKAKATFKKTKHLFEKHLVEVIKGIGLAKVGRRFDSHRVIEAIMRKKTRKYIEALYEHRKKTHPIKSFHALIGKAIKRIKGVESVERKTSRNVKRRKTENEFWKLTDEFEW